LLDDELGVHADLDVGVGCDAERCIETGDETGILRDVVAGPTKRCGPFDEDLARGGVTDQGTEPGNPRVAP
jgi:hypothetical protein